MGQRHQLFVIAKVGEHYRSLAAVHHHWLYGMSALRQCLLLLQIFSTEANRPMLRQELAMAERHFRDEEPPPIKAPFINSSAGSPIQFPFIMTCLMVGAGYNASDCTASVVHEEPFGMGYDQGDNNDGITVLDISDLSQVKYCFVNFLEHNYFPDEDSDDEDANKAEMLHKPLTGRQYLTSYYQPSELMYQQNIMTIETLDAKPLIKINALAETWPWGQWKFEPRSDSIPTPLRNTSKLRGPRSLFDQSLSKVVDTALSSDKFNFDLIDESVQIIPLFKERLRGCLIKRFADRVGHSPTSAPLLKLAYGDDKIIDWSPFSNLRVECLKNALAGEELKAMTSLVISGTTAAQSPHLVDALSQLNRIESVYALSGPDREQDITSIKIYSDLATTSPRLIQKKIALSGPFSEAIRRSRWFPYQAPIIPAFPVVQLLTYHDLMTDGIRSDFPQLESFFLGDALLSPVRAVTGFFRYLECLNDGVFERINGTALRVAKCFAAASSSLGVSQDVEIGPLPAEVYKYGKAAYLTSAAKGRYSMIRHLMPGQWTIFLWASPPGLSEGVDLCSSVAFKYAFVRSKVPVTAAAPPENSVQVKVEDLEALDVKEFLRQTDPTAETDKLQDHTDSLIRRIFGQEINSKDVANLRPRILQCMKSDEAHHFLHEFLNEIPNIERIHERVSRWGL
ncbi:hypothetical protein BGZ63DRAFT_354729 [Mariannaea sp. PMI_226]|nr:hypothetical protein BGZ63DRAFT_354729 [Mariannaea sp. PMI_226]